MYALSPSPRGYSGDPGQSDDSSERPNGAKIGPVFLLVIQGNSGLQNPEFLKVHRSLTLGINKTAETATEVGIREDRTSTTFSFR